MIQISSAADRAPSTWRTIREFLAVNPLRMTMVLFCLMAAGMAEGLGVMTLLPVLGIATGQMPDSNLNRIVTDALALVGLKPVLPVLLFIVVAGVALKAALTLLSQRNIGHAAADFATELRLRLIQSLMRARWSYFIRLPSGRITNALATEVTSAAGAYNALANLMAAAIQVALFSALALLASWQVTVIGLLAGGAMIALLHGLVGRARRAGTRQVGLMNVLMVRFADGLQLIKPLKAMALEGRIVPLLEQDAKAINVTQRQLMTTTAALSVFQEPVFTVFMAIGLYIALTYTQYSLADLLFMAILFQRIVVRAGALQVQYQKLSSQEAAYLSVRSSLHAAETEREAFVAAGHMPTLRSGIRVENISFSYDETRRILDRCTLDIPANQLTAVVGASGTGKTTLVDLVIGLLRPQAGRILVDGVPLDAIDQHAWRSSIGYMPQDLVLLHDTIAANITLGDPALSEADVEAALRAAGAWPFVSALPDGIHTLVGERGARFSGGQRQRISLARALVRRPALLILDEPTTALDPETERELCQTLKQLTDATTILAISHQRAITEAANIVHTMSPEVSHVQ